MLSKQLLTPVLMLVTVASVGAFPVLSTQSATKPTTALGAAPQSDSESSPNWMAVGQKTLASAFLAASLWSSPFVPNNHHDLLLVSNQAGQINSMVANAKEMASGTGSRVNKDAESLLRYGLPIKNKEVRKLQLSLETVKYDIASKRKSAALDGTKKSLEMMKKDVGKYKASCRDGKVCEDLVASMTAGIDPLSDAIKTSMDSLNGSDQERAALDKAYAAHTKLLDSLNILEEQMVPAGYKTPVPEEYSDLPQLQGRATVEMLVKKEKAGDTFDVNGLTFPEAKMTMVIDGYAAPITGGNFVELVQKGFYNKMAIQRSDGFVVQTGDPDGEADGYVAPGSKAVGNGKHGERLIPLEIFVQGDAGPFYETTIEDEGRGGQATILPFSSYGAMGWAREEYDANSGSSQFFWLLFDSDLTPAGKNVLDGRYPCFGYVVEGSDFLQDIKEGDMIVSATLTSGAENLKLPSQ
eukprot:CAMPEP_0172444822 /NCGR_PEP_ID=MMETSP1065-20121228/4823_1 /TAXON_ID=265537 /ORGANISM="Amphiprora paludosa, Strain CCMP125" /LENGTH=466 /DNA_ID=CAMNT_0013195523 /DNA_START=107 /DNA_END=1507 /DNA_ORIENTATION=+